MELNYESIKNKPTVLLSHTGFTKEEFERLLLSFKDKWGAHIGHHTLAGKIRIRLNTAKKTDILKTIEDKLLFVLVYTKTYTIQQVHASLFGMTQPQANGWIHLLTPILNKALKQLKMLPERNAFRVEQALQNEAVVLQDATERPIQRSKDNETQHEHYSGKKNGT